MNAYVVRTKDRRTYVEPVLDDGSGPEFDTLPISPVIAPTPGRAKTIFMREFAHGSRTGVYSDDFLNLRVRLLARDVDQHEGVSNDEKWWWKISEAYE